MISITPFLLAKPNTAIASRSRFLTTLWLGLFCGLVALGGCQSTAPQRKLDRKLEDYAEAANELYAEGYVNEAIVDYRKAVRRAWAMDDPVESGNNAYNLAACMFSKSRIAEARDWLVDARVEFRRGGMSAGNAWLLDAKIAIDQGMFDLAADYLQRAGCSNPPCDESECLCAPDDPCREGCVAKIPCVGKIVKKRDAKADCEDAFRAQVLLGRARWYAE